MPFDETPTQIDVVFAQQRRKTADQMRERDQNRPRSQSPSRRRSGSPPRRCVATRPDRTARMLAGSVSAVHMRWDGEARLARAHAAAAGMAPTAAAPETRPRPRAGEPASPAAFACRTATLFVPGLTQSPADPRRRVCAAATEGRASPRLQTVSLGEGATRRRGGRRRHRPGAGGGRPPSPKAAADRRLRLRSHPRTSHSPLPPLPQTPCPPPPSAAAAAAPSSLFGQSCGMSESRLSES